MPSFEHPNMDTKMTILSGLLAFLLVSSGAILLLGDENSNSDDETPNDSEQDNPTQINTSPTIFVPEQLDSQWNGSNVTVSGFVVDENRSTTSVNLVIIDSSSLEQIGSKIQQIPNSEGEFLIETPLSQPGTWLLQFEVEDSDGMKSDVSTSTLTIHAPVEDDVLLTFLWIQPVENSTTGTLLGVMLHTFPNTCSVEYHPLGQSPARLIEGSENTSTGEYTMQVNTSYHNTEGDIIANCGLFMDSSTTVRVNLPVPPAPETDLDSDGVLDDADQCDSTPEGEPVYATGCSDSETDDDGDGVMNDSDLCPNTPSEETVDSDGCSLSQKDSDNDGVNDAIDNCPNTPVGEVADSGGCSTSQKDSDGDGVADDLDVCPNTAAGVVVGPDGCAVPNWSPEDSWMCTDGQGPWVKDYNGDGNGYTANSNGVNSAGGSGSGPWFQCEVSVTVLNNEMVVESNGIPNHDFLSTMGCCAPEKDFTTTFPLNPVNDTAGGHDTTNCPASAGRWECVPDRGTVAMSVNGAPIFGPEEGPGGDAVALHFDYFNEDRQPIVLGWCTGHSAGQGGFHYHYDANCVYWEPEAGESMEDYDSSKIKSDEHSPIIGWAFDGYPIYGMYGYNEDQTSLKAITSSYGIERTQEGGDQGYNGIDDWNYIDGSGDLDECNGRFGATPEYQDGIYHYVSTPLSGSPTMVTDTNGQTVGMIGFPYFLLCYHGIADVDGQSVGGGQGGGGGGGGGGPPGANTATTLYSHMPELLAQTEDDNTLSGILWDTTWLILLLAALAFLRTKFKTA